MRPIIFAGCTGWLHDVPQAVERNLGAVVCGALGHEALWSHRGQRFIAESLAEHGIPALRFDYRGTGDALGVEEDPARLATWLDDIRTAVDTVRRSTGVQRVVLVGLRFGATLAALAVREIPAVHGLALLAPVINGNTYLRELSILQTSWLNSSATHVERTPPLEGVSETLGHRFYGDTVAHIKAIDLCRSELASASQVLILEHGARVAAAILAEHYRNQGAQVRLHRFDEYPALMTETGINRLPLEAVRLLCGWAEGVGVAQAVERRPCRVTDSELYLHAEDFVEAPVRFGERAQLFGMYCRPKHLRSITLTVLLPNTGGNHHIGDARLWVLLARRLARYGIASMRMDLGRLGDSLEAADTSPEESLYDAANLADLAAGAAWLRGRQHRKVVAIGVCSGAYLAVRTAVTYGCLDGMILINQDRFVWGSAPVHAAASTASIAAHSTSRAQMQSARQLDKWLAVLRGEINPLPKLKSLIGRVVARRIWTLRRTLLRPSAFDSNHGGMAALEALSRRGVKTHFLFGTFDIGLESGEFYFGSGFNAVKRLPNISVTLSPKIDHALFLYDGREAVWSEVQTFLDSHFDAALQVQSHSPLSPKRLVQG